MGSCGQGQVGDVDVQGVDVAWSGRQKDAASGRCNRGLVMVFVVVVVVVVFRKGFAVFTRIISKAKITINGVGVITKTINDSVGFNPQGSIGTWRGVGARWFGGRRKGDGVIVVFFVGGGKLIPEGVRDGVGGVFVVCGRRRRVLVFGFVLVAAFDANELVHVDDRSPGGGVKVDGQGVGLGLAVVSIVVVVAAPVGNGAIVGVGGVGGRLTFADTTPVVCFAIALFLGWLFAGGCDFLPVRG